ncbi:hypothetical protein PsorP6_000193 [Peronosclerospora sorghi]|uniref:Uncharacterized protein n=1 Tax=Peronosclerospora sorghi TaxID=230839 RepID=A0ACC0WUI7_9STRA|nr:hypothetical protein PsorP6_000193 [Peronosclerospora sorghi]
MAPEWTNLVLTTDIPHRKANVFVLHRFHIEAYSNIPIVGIVVTTSPSLSLYKMVVLPAASRPTIRIRISFLPKRRSNTRENAIPMIKKNLGCAQGFRKVKGSLFPTHQSGYLQLSTCEVLLITGIAKYNNCFTSMSKDTRPERVSKALGTRFIRQVTIAQSICGFLWTEDKHFYIMNKILSAFHTTTTAAHSMKVFTIMMSPKKNWIEYYLYLLQYLSRSENANHMF